MYGMTRRRWQAIGAGVVVVLLLMTIGAIRLVRRSTWNRELVAGMDRYHWRWPGQR